MKSILLLAALAAVHLVETVHAQVPILINYQGRVAVGTPNPVNFNGSGSFKFALVNGTGTTIYWTNSLDTVPADGVPDAAVTLTVTKGLYSVMLGDTTVPNMSAIPASVFTDADVRLRVWFNDGTNGSQRLTPDQRLAPSAYFADGAVSAAKIASGAVTSAKIAAGAINGTHLAPASLNSSHLIVPTAPGTGQVLGFDGGSLKWIAPGGGVFALNGTSGYYNGGNVGIGTADPAWPLDVNGSMHVGDYSASGTPKLIRFGDGDYVSIGENGQDDQMELTASRFVFKSGNVGIGTLTPQENLSITNGANVDQGDTNGGNLFPGLKFGSFSGEGISSKRSPGGNQWGLDFYTGNIARLSILNNGNVGIGTSTPGANLHLRPNTSEIEPQKTSIRVDSAGIGNGSPNSLLLGAEGPLFLGSAFIDTTKDGVAAPTPLSLRVDGSEKIRIAPDGNVGIGMSNPSSRLDVAGNEDSNVQVGTFRVSRGDSPAKYMYMGYDGADFGYIQPIHIGVAWKNLALSPHGGNVGIGTTSPQEKLHVSGNAIVTGDIIFGNSHLGSSGGTGAFLELRGTGFGQFIDFSNDLSTDFDMRLLLLDDNTLQVEGGNLHVNGTTQTRVLEIIGGSDVAEPFAVSHPTKPEPGMVMAIDREHPGELRVSTDAYDKTVAGIISGANGVNPGLTLRQEGTVADGEYPLALSGRVYCWCDADYGEIQPGDLLTTSDTLGHAMVASDTTRTPGATIGKAMTGLKDGKGLVLVLVTLQ